MPNDFWEYDLAESRQFPVAFNPLFDACLFAASWPGAYDAVSGKLGIFEKEKQNMAANYSSHQQFPGDYDVVFNAVLKAAMLLGFGVTLHDKDSGLILAKTGFSMQSFGEKIHITLSKEGVLAVKSECVLPTQIFSWGKNEKNVNSLFMMTTSVLSNG